MDLIADFFDLLDVFDIFNYGVELVVVVVTIYVFADFFIGHLDDFFTFDVVVNNTAISELNNIDRLFIKLWNRLDIIDIQLRHFRHIQIVIVVQLRHISVFQLRHQQPTIQHHLDGVQHIFVHRFTQLVNCIIADGIH